MVLTSWWTFLRPIWKILFVFVFLANFVLYYILFWNIVWLFVFLPLFSYFSLGMFLTCFLRFWESEPHVSYLCLKKTTTCIWNFKLVHMKFFFQSCTLQKQPPWSPILAHSQNLKTLRRLKVTLSKLRCNGQETMGVPTDPNNVGVVSFKLIALIAFSLLNI